MSVLYEQALKHEKMSFISATGALMVSSNAKTGRSPQVVNLCCKLSSMLVVERSDLSDEMASCFTYCL